jgi:hypothetical protein
MKGEFKVTETVWAGLNLPRRIIFSSIPAKAGIYWYGRPNHISDFDIRI